MQRTILGSICVLLALVVTPSFAHTAKTCPDCNCIWVDAAGNKSETPVAIPIAGVKDAPNNRYYSVKSDPDKPCKNQGATKCECRIIIRTSWTPKGGKAETGDQVVEGGKDGLREIRFGALVKEGNERIPKRTVSLIPACAMLDKEGKPEYGEPHE